MFANIMPTFLIALGGASGTLLRYWIGLATARWSQSLPWGTIMINATGSFAIAFLAGITAVGGRWQVSDTSRLVFMVGLCGGYTTFSSFSLQTLDLLRNGTPGRAALNIGLSVALCMITVWLGYVAALALNPTPPGEGM
ncbi:fluoride efflux transporter CrcB [Acetobacter conturbans]|uniref:Fluoride-specific ion channel FluC n=1 Tax=Acetobacter conturbans TaxID=1737472 RepID=A0ABX0JY76_9PROT|nr:fluoride efflux transporter CrcB [Acetobacter conturbans]NHN87960.1 fluoride efflux transporter CrcB [Acetobacter conturbans]